MDGRQGRGRAGLTTRTHTLTFAVRWTRRRIRTAFPELLEDLARRMCDELGCARADLVALDVEVDRWLSPELPARITVRALLREP